MSISCEACKNIFASDVQVCPLDCPDDERKEYWKPHHPDIAGLCQSALSGCRLCAEVWRHFFKEKTPIQYAEEPYFEIGQTVHAFHGSGTSFWVSERLYNPSADVDPSASTEDDGITLNLTFGLNSPMIREVEERNFILKKTSGNYDLL